MVFGVNNMINNELCSTQVNVDTKLQFEINQFIDSILNLSDLSSDGIERESHITVKYGIESEEDVNLISELVKSSDVNSIKIKLGRTSIFRNEEHDVVKISVISNDLKKLNKLITDNCKTVTTFLNYSPHLTLFYTKPGEGDKYINNDKFKGVEFTTDHFLFSDKNRNKTKIDLTYGKNN